MIRHLTTEITLTLRILFRQPGFWIPTVLFPAMLYAFFGANSGGGAWASHAMASFAVYAVLGVGFFQFGVSVAQDRASPFASHKARAKRARLILQSIGTRFTDRKPGIDLSQYANVWPELRGWRPATT